MKYKIELLDSSDLGSIQELIDSVELNEALDYECQFLGARNGSMALLGIVGVVFDDQFPRFEHIIVHPDYQKTRLGVLLMRATEQLLRKREYEQYVAYVLNTDKLMQRYAKKWGMIPYKTTDEGIWFYKNL